MNCWKKKVGFENLNEWATFHSKSYKSLKKAIQILDDLKKTMKYEYLEIRKNVIDIDDGMAIIGTNEKYLEFYK